VVASTLETDLEDHLRLEETEVFPLVDRVLAPDVREVIVGELRARRRPAS
jgi:hypothetical protein